MIKRGSNRLVSYAVFISNKVAGTYGIDFYYSYRVVGYSIQCNFSNVVNAHSILFGRSQSVDNFPFVSGYNLGFAINRSYFICQSVPLTVWFDSYYFMTDWVGVSITNTIGAGQYLMITFYCSPKR